MNAKMEISLVRRDLSVESVIEWLHAHDDGDPVMPTPRKMRILSIRDFILSQRLKVLVSAIVRVSP